MNRWWRAYDSSKDDPKLLLLPSDTLRWQWYVLMCVASQNGGKIPSIEVAAVGLRLPINKAARVIAALHKAGLMDETPGGYFEPHNWKGRQYESDHDPTRNERQQRYRDKKRNALRNGENNALRNTVGVTRTETETETDTEADADQHSLTSFQITTSEGMSIGEVKEKRRTPPRHCAVSRDKKHVYIETNTPEWEAYASDYRDVHHQEPQPNAHGGKWFSAQGEAA